MNAVMPNLFASFIPNNNDSYCFSAVNSGNTLSIIFIADSRNVPKGSPVFVSRTMVPLGGSAVVELIPANSIALELTQALCPKASDKNTGRPPKISSSISLEGAPSGKSNNSQPPPITHSSIL